MLLSYEVRQVHPHGKEMKPVPLHIPYPDLFLRFPDLYALPRANLGTLPVTATDLRMDHNEDFPNLEHIRIIQHASPT